MLELANEVLREPSFPQVELDTLRQQALAGMESQKSEPQAVTMRAFQQHLSPYRRATSATCRRSTRRWPT